MSDPTPPAVSDAMREGVARDVAEWPDKPLGFHGQGLASHLSRPAGPIASEIARLTGENADLREQAGRTVSIRQMQEVVERLRAAEAETAVLTAECKVYRNLAEKYAAAAEAAEAETARLRAVLQDCRNTIAKPNPGICCTIWFDGITTLQDHIDQALAVNRPPEPEPPLLAALSSQEKTDG